MGVEATRKRDSGASLSGLSVLVSASVRQGWKENMHSLFVNQENLRTQANIIVIDILWLHGCVGFV